MGSAGIKFIPTGGLYVTGGLTPKNMKFIQGHKSEFMKSYHNKGRVSPILNEVPILAVLTEDLGVRGAHKCAQIVSVLISIVMLLIFVVVVRYVL